MSIWCLDPTLVEGPDVTDLHKSSLSRRFGVPHYTAEQDTAQKLKALVQRPEDAIVKKLESIFQTPRDIVSEKSKDLESILRDHVEYIVVGGGTAGLALASRLAEQLEPGKCVFVIEAGKYRQEALVDVPGLYGLAGGNLDFDWSYKTVPQPNLHGNQVSSSAGRLLGGSSGINYLVRMRASSPEYDAWNEFGTGWNWQGLLPSFKAEESYAAYEWGTDQIFPGITHEDDLKARREEPAFRGHDGPVHSTHNTLYTELLKPTIETTLNGGIKTNRTPGYGDSTGMFNIDTAVNRKQGIRSYAANSYLKDPELIVPQPNLIILKETYAMKIQFDSSKPPKAVSLLCLGNMNWKSPESTLRFELPVNKEIIVAAGSYNTPRLLELSGIGNPEILSKFNITPVVSLPTVGENLQEHTFLVSDFVVKDGVFTFDRLRNSMAYQEAQIQEYLEHGTGAYATTVSAYGFIKLKNFLNEAEVQELKEELNKEIENVQNKFHKRQLEIQKGFLENDSVGDVELIMVEKAFATVPAQDSTSYISLVVSLPHPVARGSVHISSSDPLADPSINPNYLNNNYDTKIMTKAALFVRKLSQTAPLSEIIVRPSTPGPEVQTEAQFEKFVRNNLGSMQHPIGTSAMAPRQLGGVVDEKLSVYGTQNLRVVDMSIAPLHLAAHLLDTAYAIGEKASKRVAVTT
ncbi:hypothetical protein GYMLUDRAFT_263776 [Collybiopsis luxurians FD-317 M1]|uniref:Glucose-methanol-choline oxidoreductase N-terminal domain-containing protein n=1 Tax=Collybiopsis luxurians FD-317 M1 TaxID=944289 RepID=A0A0D0C1V5_9AGAR|nr:hypothetical protein GYMLUDRAFT_263776 [Collybiopsis luxurians FD-317 M1]